MGLGKKVRKFFLKTGLRYLPLAAAGLIGISFFINPKEDDNLKRAFSRWNTAINNISPDATQIAFSTNQLNNRTDTDVYTAGMNGENLKATAATEQDEYFKKWSPDGKSIIFERDKMFYAFELATGTEQRILSTDKNYRKFFPEEKELEEIISTPDLPFKPAYFSATDNFIAFAHKKGTAVSVLDLNTGEIEKIGEWAVSEQGYVGLKWNGPLLAVNPYFSAEHRQIKAHTETDDIYVYDAGKKSLEKITQKGSEIFYRWLPDKRMLVLSDKDANIWPVVEKEAYALSLDGRYERLTWLGTGQENAVLGYLKKTAYVFGILGAMSLLGVYAGWRARKRRKILEPHKGLDKILDYPEATSLAASLGFGAGAATATFFAFNPIHESFYENLMHLHYLKTPAKVVLGSWLASLSAIMWPPLYSIANAYSRIRSLKNIPAAWNQGISIASKVMAGQPLNAAYETRKSLEMQVVEDDKTFLEKANIEIYEGRPVDAIKEWNLYLQYRKRRPETGQEMALSWFENIGPNTFLIPVLLRKNNISLKERPGDIGLLTEQQLIYLTRSKNKKARQISEKILSLPDCTDAYRIFQSFVLDTIEMGNEADKIRQEVFSRLPEGDIIKMTGNQIFPKPGRQGKLQKEAERLEFLRQRMPSYDADAARPFGIYTINGREFLLEVLTDGTLLYDLLEKNPDLGILGKAAKAQAVMHGLLRHEKDRDLNSEISRFVNSNKDLPGTLGGVLAVLLKCLGNYQAADSDGHRHNSHYAVTEQIAVFDKEPRGSCPIAFDYAKLFRQGRIAGTWEQQKAVLYESAEQYNRMVSPERRVPPGELPEQVLRASPYKALRFALFAADKPEKHNCALQFLENARKHDLPMLAEGKAIAKSNKTVIDDALKKAEEKIQTAA